MTRAMTKPLALITGASRGLGHALARSLSADHHVLAVARTTGALEELDDAIKATGGVATLAPMDITDDGAMQTLARGIHDRWGGLALWCHTAIRADALSPAGHIAAKDLKASIDVNITATQRLIGYLEPLLKAAGGTAVFFDDPRGGAKFQGCYGMTKAAQVALAHSWKAETAATGPRVIIARPAPMPTAVRARFHPGEDRSGLASIDDEAARILASL